jgi:hypothetical protein
MGIDWDLEDKSRRILVQDRKSRGLVGPKVNSEEYPWLTPEQLKHRENHEIGNSTGFPDPELFSGTFIRAFNPLFGKRRPGKNDD